MYCSVTAAVDEKLPFHRHATHELIVCKSDNGELEVNGHTYLYKTGRTFLLPGGIQHRISGSSNAIAQTQFICFDNKALMNLNLISLKSHLSHHYTKYTIAEKSDNKKIYALNNELGNQLQFEVDTPTLYSTQLSKNILAQLLINHCRHINIPHLIKINNKHFSIEKCCEEILSDPCKPVSLAALAKKYGMSRSTFSAQFKNVTGKSLIEYTQTVRLDKASQQLATTNESITHIAFSSGFGNLGNFYKAFKRLFRMTPADYRHWAKNYGSALDKNRQTG